MDFSNRGRDQQKEGLLIRERTLRIFGGMGVEPQGTAKLRDESEFMMLIPGVLLGLTM